MAPISQLRITIKLTGTVLPGQDVSQNGTGHALIESTNPQSPARMTLEFPGNETAVYRLTSGASGPVPWTNLDVTAMREVLAKGELHPTSDQEVEELIGALLGAVAGPKTGIAKGQAEHLVVVEAGSVYD